MLFVVDCLAQYCGKNIQNLVGDKAKEIMLSERRRMKGMEKREDGGHERSVSSTVISNQHKILVVDG